MEFVKSIFVFFYIDRSATVMNIKIYQQVLMKLNFMMKKAIQILERYSVVYPILMTSVVTPVFF